MRLPALLQLAASVIELGCICVYMWLLLDVIEWIGGNRP